MEKIVEDQVKIIAKGAEQIVGREELQKKLDSTLPYGF